MTKRVGDNIAIESSWDPRLQARCFQVIVVNKDNPSTFVVRKDLTGRDYLKLKLTDAEVFALIQELQKSIGSTEFGPKIVQTKFGKVHLELVKKEDSNE